MLMFFRRILFFPVLLLATKVKDVKTCPDTLSQIQTTFKLCSVVVPVWN